MSRLSTSRSNIKQLNTAGEEDQRQHYITAKPQTTKAKWWHGGLIGGHQAYDVDCEDFDEDDDSDKDNNFQIVVTYR